VIDAKSIRTTAPLIDDTKKQSQFMPVAVRLSLVLVLVIALMSLMIFSLQGNTDVHENTKVFAQEPVSEGSTAVFPPMRAPTPSGTYIVEVDWQPEMAGIEGDTVFLVKFLDGSDAPLTPPSVVNYDFRLTGQDLAPIKAFFGQETEDDGIGRPLIVQFENGGPMEITVTIHSVGSLSSADSLRVDESVAFNMTVVPEFPISALLLVTAGLTAAVILINRVQHHLFMNAR